LEDPSMNFASVASRRRHRLWGVAAALAALAASTPLSAQGDLLIAPTRLILDGRRGGEVTLSNIGSEEATYRVTLELRRMTPEGELEPVDEASANVTEKAALEMIRYAPRRVILPPGEPQAIRITARPGAELPDGEYRVHLSFSAVPKVQPIAPQDGVPAEGVAIRLVPIYGITMPIIIRKGQVEVTAALANPRLEDGPGEPAFAVDISRSGNASVYGDLLVYRRGSDQPAFAARGIGVYPEIDARHARFEIPAEQAAAMRGPVRIELREALESGGALITAMDAML
jgi:hypothetical protein